MQMSAAKDASMSYEEYTQTQTTILMLVGIVHDLPLDEFIAAIHHANAVGPIIDPTLYIKASSNLDKIGTLAHGLRKFQQAIETVMAEEVKA